MKKYPLIPLIVLCSLICLSAQVGNSREVLVKNKVKSSLEKQCFCDPDAEDFTGSCTVIAREYDRQGNLTFYNFYRIGTNYRYIYDERGNEIMTLWISDQTDTLRTEYDEHDNPIFETYPEQEPILTNNKYDRDDRLIKTVSDQENEDGNIWRETTELTYTPSGKIKSRATEEELIEVLQPVEDEGPWEGSRYEYAYDKKDRLVRTQRYYRGYLKRTTHNQYDKKGRQILEVIDDPDRVAIRNEMRGRDHPEIKWMVTAWQYNDQDQITWKYDHYLDPCMGLDGLYLFKHDYHDNGLLKKVYMMTRERRTELYFGFEYEFYE